jgi:seryl-tRNA synthetase
LDLETLPLRYAGFSTCFRREAGTYGKDTTGIFRVHQFDKVEMFSFCNPEKSKDEHEYLLSIEEEILQELEIPYRVVDVCTGDLGASGSKKI